LRTPVLDEPLLDVGHRRSENSVQKMHGVLALVLLEDVGLHGAAHGRQHPGTHPPASVRTAPGRAPREPRELLARSPW
jgi:hypothetical protein